MPIFVAEDGRGKLDAYLVCKIIDDVVWVESLYVTVPERRKGIAKRLYLEAEKVALKLCNETLFNWFQPTMTK